MCNESRGLLSEFGITINKGPAAFKRDIPDILEDAENGLPDILRPQVADMYQSYLNGEQHLLQVTNQLKGFIKQQAQCRQLMALEGVGPVNALSLVLALGDKASSFSHGREAAACIGLTPKQYSTGGVVVLGGIGKKVGNKRLRSNLIQGALAVVQVVAKRAARSTKEQWLKIYDDLLNTHS